VVLLGVLPKVAAARGVFVYHGGDGAPVLLLQGVLLQGYEGVVQSLLDTMF